MRRFIAYLFLLLYLGANSQMRFTHLRVEQGLSQSSVNFVLRDSKGFYWIGTQYGLNKFDGQNIVSYYAGPSSIPDNFILNGLEDKNGNLWFGTRNHLCRYNYLKNSFTSIVLEDPRAQVRGHNSVWNLFTDNENNLYFTSGGKLWTISWQNLLEENPKPAKALDQDLHIGPAFFYKQQLYIFLEKEIARYKKTPGGFVASGRIKWPFQKPSSERALFKNDSILLLARDNKIFKLTGDSLVELFKKVFTNENITAVQELNGRVFIGTENGLYYFANTGKNPVVYKNSPGNNYSLGENKILSLSLTSDSILWVGNADAGVNFINVSKRTFSIVKRDANKPYICYSGLAIKDSALLVGSSSGVDEFVKKEGEWIHVRNRLEGKKITALCQSGKSLWIGTPAGLWLAENNSLGPIKLDEGEVKIFGIKPLGDGQIGICSIRGFYVIDEESKKVLKHLDITTNLKNGKKLLKVNYIFSCLRLRNGNTLINHTTGSTELDKDFELVKEHFNDSSLNNLSDIMITQNLEDSKGNLWFASLGGGIYKKDRLNGLSRYRKENGLSNNVAQCILQDKEGNTWAGTNYGINCIGPDNRITSFTKELQLESPEFSEGGAFSNDANLYFCSNSGLLEVNPVEALNRNNPVKPVLFLNRLTKNYTDTLYAIENFIRLTWKDKVISFEFVVPGILDFEKVKLNYKLNNLDTAWRQIDNGKAFSFTGLAPGNYELIVKAFLPGGHWNEQQRFRILISPPFWKTPGFITVCILALVLGVGFAVRYFSRLKLKKRLLQMALNEQIYKEKERISRDLHDNIGSQISYLIYGLDRIKEEKKEQNTAEAGKLSEYARKTLNELRNTIWALNKDEVTVNELGLKLAEYCSELSANFGPIEINYTENLQNSYSLNPQVAIVFFRIAQEAAGNALKHSRCSMLSIDFVSNNNEVRLRVKDNGSGFDTGIKKPGHYGLGNMAARARQAGLRYGINSMPAQGTIVEVVLATKKL